MSSNHHSFQIGKHKKEQKKERKVSLKKALIYNYPILPFYHKKIGK